MNVLLSPQPPRLHNPHQYEAARISPSRSQSPFQTMSRKRARDDDGDEMIASGSSPIMASRSMAQSRPTKKFRSNELVGRPLTLSRLIETLDAADLRKVIERICERHQHVGQEVVNSAPRPTPEAALRVLEDYQEKLNQACPYGNSSEDYTYFRVRAPLVALLEAVADFTTQYLPPVESQATISLQYLDGATKVIHNLPDWRGEQYRHHKEMAYDEISKAWALVIAEAGKRGIGFNLQAGGWDRILEKHHQQSGQRLSSAMNTMAESIGFFGNTMPMAQGHADANSIRNQLMSGTYGAPVKVGPW